MLRDLLTFVARNPRYPAIANRAAEAWLERADGRLAAELVDFSRQGAGLLVDEPANDDERVTIRVRHRESGLDLSLDGTVRWRHAEPDGTWRLGCEFVRPVSLETLGELFLHKILDSKPAPRS
jgi:hypothetical protein